MMWVYPRIGFAHAERQIDLMREAFAAGGLPEVSALAATDHSAKVPIETGGPIAQPDRLAEIRNGVLECLTPWMTESDPVATVSKDSVRFDIALGRNLHQLLNIVPSDAAHRETWSFISLVLLPDVTVVRWPGLHVDRVLGSPSKHAMQRLWIREHVLGEILDPEHPKPLGEDELFQLFDRTALARNHRLVRTLASTVAASRATKRMDWARALYKRITFPTGARLLDALNDDELGELVRSEAMQVPGASHPPRLKVRLPSNLTEARLTEAVVAAWNDHVDYSFVDYKFELDMAEFGSAEAARRLDRRSGNEGPQHPFVREVRSILGDPDFAALVLE